MRGVHWNPFAVHLDVCSWVRLPVYADWDMIFGMTGMEDAREAPATILCKSCGLCCTGHLFVWAKLRSSEVDAASRLGLNVFGSHPTQRGFSQPCPLWQGICTIHASPQYPHFCRTYKCKLLKEVIDESISLPIALTVIQQAKALIQGVELLLPGSPNANFRERLVEQLEALKDSDGQDERHLEFRQKADALLLLYETVFGVKDLVDKPDED